MIKSCGALGAVTYLPEGYLPWKITCGTETGVETKGRILPASADRLFH